MGIKNWKKALPACLCAALIFGGAVGFSGALYRQPSIIIDPTTVEIVSEAPTENPDSDSPFQVAAKGAVLIDATSGKILYQQNCHDKLAPASVTKVMTMLLVMEAVESGRIKLDDRVMISERAASMGGSQMYMEAGETHTVEELMRGVAMASANDGCVALAEFVAGSEEIFVENMNRRAEELGMRDTHFVNTNGLPVADHYSSAYDIALMSQKLYEFEAVHQWFTTWQSTITVGLPGKETELGLTNTNKMIKTYDGCDGIKTGFTSEAGYCLSASATRGQTHLIAVALGCESSKIRNAQVAKMLDFGFANYETVVLAEKGEVLETVRIEKGDPIMVDAIADDRIAVFIEKGKKDTVRKDVTIFETVPLPLEKGQEIGKITVYDGEEEIAEYPLTAAANVEKASFRELLSRLIQRTAGRS